MKSDKPTNWMEVLGARARNVAWVAGAGAVLVLGVPSSLSGAAWGQVASDAQAGVGANPLRPVARPVALPLAAQQTVQRANAGQAAPRVAFWVQAPALQSANGEVLPASETVAAMLSAQAASAGLSVVAPKDVLAAWHEAGENVGEGSSNAGTALGKAGMLRVSQMLGADYLMVVTLGDGGVKTQTISRQDLNLHRTVQTTAWVGGFRIVDASDGGTVYGGPLQASHRQWVDANGQADANALWVQAALAQQAAEQLASQLGGVMWQEQMPAKAPVAFEIAAGVDGWRVPEIVQNDEGHWVATGESLALKPLAVTVALDGAVIGSTPGTFAAKPGLHHLTLSRPGFGTWERMVNLVDHGQGPMQLNIPMAMDAAAVGQMMAVRTWLDGLQKGQILTEAEVEKTKAFAEILRNVQINLDTSALQSVHVGDNIDRGMGHHRMPSLFDRWLSDNVNEGR